MKNAIILSCSTGQGHNSCAQAVRELLEKRGVSCEINEALDFISPAFSRFVCWGHSFIYKHIPGLFRWGYDLNEDHPGLLKRGSFFYRVLTLGAGRLYRYLAQGGYDTVICTHVFTSLALTEAMKRGPLHVRTAFVDTDYTFSPGTQYTAFDEYFAPCESTREDFEKNIKTEHRTTVTGIPVRGEFWTCREKAEAKRLLRLGAENRHLLMMCGSMGCGPIVKLLEDIASALPQGLEVTVICGTNERLRKRLERLYAGDARIHVEGYRSDVSLYMDSADLYLTKPGGISVTEAAAKRLPMAFIDPVSGCEKYNMEFFTSLGGAVADTSVEGLAKKCIRLLSSGEELERMRLALERYAQPNGAERICGVLGEGT